jgi:hypothetical protein
MAEKEQIAAGAAADELTMVCERAAVSVETAPTPRQIVAAILRDIPAGATAAAIHPSRRREVAEMVARYESKMRNCADDAGLVKLAHELAEKIRLGGFRLEIGSTPEGFARREWAANGIRRTLASLGWNGREIEQAFLLAGHDERVFGNLSWDHVMLNGKQVERRAIQLAGKSVTSSESDAEWLRRNFPAIAPPKPPPTPLWLK